MKKRSSSTKQASTNKAHTVTGVVSNNNKFHYTNDYYAMVQAQLLFLATTIVSQLFAYEYGLDLIKLLAFNELFGFCLHH